LPLVAQLVTVNGFTFFAGSLSKKSLILLLQLAGVSLLLEDESLPVNSGVVNIREGIKTSVLTTEKKKKKKKKKKKEKKNPYSCGLTVNSVFVRVDPKAALHFTCDVRHQS